MSETHHDFILSTYEDQPELALWCKVFKQGIIGAAAGDRADTFWVFFDNRECYPSFSFFCDLLHADADLIRKVVREKRKKAGHGSEYMIYRRSRRKSVDKRQLSLQI